MEKHICKFDGCEKEGLNVVSPGRGKAKFYLCDEHYKLEIAKFPVVGDCVSKGCDCKATHTVNRGKKIKKGLYCYKHYQDIQNYQYECRRRRKEKPVTVCGTLVNGKRCGEKAVKRLASGAVCVCEKHLEAYRKYNREFHQKNKEKYNESHRLYRKNNPEKTKFRAALWKAGKWLQNVSIIKQIDPNINYQTFCDQDGRLCILRDLMKVGIIFINEYPFVDMNKSIREKTSIDLHLMNTGLYLEHKSSVATYLKKQTNEQVQGYEELLKEEIRMGLLKDHSFIFKSFSPSGENTDLNYADFYQFLKDYVLGVRAKFKKRYPKNWKSKFLEVFPLLKFKAFLDLCDLRTMELKKLDRYCPGSNSYDWNSIKLETVKALISGEITAKDVDLNKLKEDFDL